MLNPAGGGGSAAKMHPDRFSTGWRAGWTRHAALRAGSRPPRRPGSRQRRAPQPASGGRRNPRSRRRRQIVNTRLSMATAVRANGCRTCSRRTSAANRTCITMRLPSACARRNISIPRPGARVKRLDTPQPMPPGCWPRRFFRPVDSQALDHGVEQWMCASTGSASGVPSSNCPHPRRGPTTLGRTNLPRRHLLERHQGS